MLDELYSKGLAMRRTVLGDEHVDRSLAQAESAEFLKPLQEAVTALGWGAVWSRDGLDLKTRSMITVAMLVALNRPHELAAHVKGALNNKVTASELREIILHAALYCGWPASIDGFRTAKEVLDRSKQPQT